MTLKINFNLNLPNSCCTLVPKNGVWTVPKIAACQIAKNAALLIPDYKIYRFKIFIYKNRCNNKQLVGLIADWAFIL